jgi:hypothetical protein
MLILRTTAGLLKLNRCPAGFDCQQRREYVRKEEAKLKTEAE